MSQQTNFDAVTVSELNFSGGEVVAKCEPVDALADSSFTNTAPVALTAAAAGAIAAAVVGPTAAALTDTQALRTVVNQIVVDITAIRARQATLITEGIAMNTRLNALLHALNEFGIVIPD